MTGIRRLWMEFRLLPTFQRMSLVTKYWSIEMQFWVLIRIYPTQQLSQKTQTLSGNSDSSFTHMQHASVTVTLSAPKIFLCQITPPIDNLRIHVTCSLQPDLNPSWHIIYSVEVNLHELQYHYSYCGPFLDWSPSRPKYYGNIKWVPSRFFFLACKVKTICHAWTYAGSENLTPNQIVSIVFVVTSTWSIAALPSKNFLLHTRSCGSAVPKGGSPLNFIRSCSNNILSWMDVRAQKYKRELNTTTPLLDHWLHERGFAPICNKFHILMRSLFIPRVKRMRGGDVLWLGMQRQVWKTCLAEARNHMKHVCFYQLLLEPSSFNSDSDPII